MLLFCNRLSIILEFKNGEWNCFLCDVNSQSTLFDDGQIILCLAQNRRMKKNTIRISFYLPSRTVHIHTNGFTLTNWSQFEVLLLDRQQYIILSTKSKKVAAVERIGQDSKEKARKCSSIWLQNRSLNIMDKETLDSSYRLILGDAWEDLCW